MSVLALPAAGRGRSLAHPADRAHSRRVALPTYDRSRLGGGVVHLGVGGFHRAHQAVYFDDLAQRRISTRWGITGVSLRRRDTKAALEPQGGLFTVVERSDRGDRARVVGSLLSCLAAREEPHAVLAALTEARTRLVTLTVTADGYGTDRLTGKFLADRPEVARELSQATRPVSAYGYIVEALARRRAAGTPPFTVLSCDNLPDNGAAARNAVVGFAELRDAGLARWIADHVAFPSSVVDRITPRSTAADRHMVAAAFGIHDRLPVLTEPFSQWIVEDTFCDGRPPLDAVGARFVTDVAPHKLVKARLLNGSHCALGPLGMLAGHETTDAAMSDPLLLRYVSDLMNDEVAPLLRAPAGLDLGDYQRTLLARLANPAIVDQLARLCERGSTKLPCYLLPSLADAIATGRPHRLLTLAVAGWIRHLSGHDDAGRPHPVADAMAPTLAPLARAAGTDPAALAELLAHREVFGDVGREPAFVTALAAALEDLRRLGVRATLASHLDRHVPLAA